MTGINNVSLASGVITADGRDGPVNNGLFVNGSYVANGCKDYS